jgi:hypothetical protein
MAVLCLAASRALWTAPARAGHKAPGTYRIPTPPPADYSKLEWLIGEWAGKTVGKGPQGDVLLSASYALGKRFMILREEVSLPATKAAPATQERSMGILSSRASGKAYDLALYSSTGFITHYQVSAENGTVDFIPEGGLGPPPGWLFRRSIRRTTTEQCVETVEVAPPGEAFFSYYTANLSHVRPGANPNHVAAPEKSKHHKFLFWRKRH